MTELFRLSRYVVQRPQPSTASDPSPKQPAGQRPGLSRASSHKAVTLEEKDTQSRVKKVRVKTNHYGQEATFHELLAANVLRWLGVPHSPEVRLALGPNDGSWHIASTRVEGFTDWGRFLRKRKKGIKHVAPDSRASYQTLHKQHRAVETGLAFSRRDDEALQTILADAKQYKTGKPTTAPFERIPAPYRNALRHQLHFQDAMLELLPAEFKTALVNALFIQEIVGNWDFANHARANAGFVIRDGKLAGATAVDFGNSGHNGFGGQTKAQTPLDAFNQPARIDDAYHSPSAHGPDPTPRKLPEQAQSTRFNPRTFAQVSPSLGLIAYTPRSEVFAGLMRPTVQRLNDDPQHIPDAACAVAHRLACLPPNALSQLINTLHDEFTQHAGGKELNLNVEQIQTDYVARIQAIQERIPAPALERWRLRHPEKAKQIEMEVSKALEEAEQTPRGSVEGPSVPGHLAACGTLMIPRKPSKLD